MRNINAPRSVARGERKTWSAFREYSEVLINEGSIKGKSRVGAEFNLDGSSITEPVIKKKNSEISTSVLLKFVIRSAIEPSRVSLFIQNIYNASGELIRENDRCKIIDRPNSSPL